MRYLLVCLTLAAALAAPALSHAAPYQDGHCQVTVPDGWIKSKTRIASVDKKVWASLLEAPTAAEIIAVETGLNAVKLSENGQQILMVSTASYGGLTNKQYHAITKTSPSCVADVTAPAGPDEALAKSIAQSVVMKK